MIMKNCVSAGNTLYFLAVHFRATNIWFSFKSTGSSCTENWSFSVQKISVLASHRWKHISYCMVSVANCYFSGLYFYMAMFTLYIIFISMIFRRVRVHAKVSVPQVSPKQQEEQYTIYNYEGPACREGSIAQDLETGNLSFPPVSAWKLVCSSVLPYWTHVPYLFTVAHLVRRICFAMIIGNYRSHLQVNCWKAIELYGIFPYAYAFPFLLIEKKCDSKSLV